MTIEYATPNHRPESLPAGAQVVAWLAVVVGVLLGVPALCCITPAIIGSFGSGTVPAQFMLRHPVAAQSFGTLAVAGLLGVSGVVLLRRRALGRRGLCSAGWLLLCHTLPMLPSGLSLLNGLGLLIGLSMAAGIYAGLGRPRAFAEVVAVTGDPTAATHDDVLTLRLFNGYRVLLMLPAVAYAEAGGTSQVLLILAATVAAVAAAMPASMIPHLAAATIVSLAVVVFAVVLGAVGGVATVPALSPAYWLMLGVELVLILIPAGVLIHRALRFGPVLLDAPGRAFVVRPLDGRDA